MIGVPAVTGRPAPDDNTASPADRAPAEGPPAKSTLAAARDAIDAIFVRVDATPSMWLFR